MKISFQKNIHGLNDIPNLVIPISELLKAKNHKKDEQAFEELQSFQSSIQIYTSFCGVRMNISSREYDNICNQIGKTGSLVLTCLQDGNNPAFQMRLLSNEGEKNINLKMIEVIKGRIIR